MRQSLVLAIDQGGQSSRVGIYSTRGGQLFCFSAPCITTREFVNGVEYIEQDPQHILNGIKNCLDKVQATLGEDITRIIAAGFAGQGSSLLCWDKHTGEALTPVLSWQDTRGEQYLENFPLTQAHVQSRTGLRISPHYGASKIRWCLDNNPRVQQAREKNSLMIGPIVSYIFWHLCGETAVDPGHAQRTLLWNLYSENWDKQLLEVFNISRSLLPICKYHNSYFGNVMLGHYRVPFSVSARDQGASVFARGLPDKNICYVNIGTGAFIQRVSENLNAPEGLLVSPLWISKPLVAEEVEVSSPTCYAHEIKAGQQVSLYAWEATVNGAASAIKLIEQETGLNVTPELIDRVLKSNEEHDYYFLNAVGGVSAPYWRTDLKSCFSHALSPREKILAWLESIIFQIAVNVNLMNQPANLHKIFISGGISRADGICQRLADLLDKPVIRSENTDATLQGVAYMAAGLPNEWSRSSEDEIFRPASNSALLKTFWLWHNAMREWTGHKL